MLLLRSQDLCDYCHLTLIEKFHHKGKTSVPIKQVFINCILLKEAYWAYSEEVARVYLVLPEFK